MNELKQKYCCQDELDSEFGANMDYREKFYPPPKQNPRPQNNKKEYVTSLNFCHSSF